MSIFTALIKPGDNVLALSHLDGGHYSYSKPDWSIVKKFFSSHSYKCDPASGRIDYDNLHKMAE